MFKVMLASMWALGGGTLAVVGTYWVAWNAGTTMGFWTGAIAGLVAFGIAMSVFAKGFQVIEHA